MPVPERPWKLVAVFLLLTLAGAWAQGDRFVTFITDPPGAKIYSVHGDLLGVAGQKMPVSALGAGSVTLFFRYPGYTDKQENIPVGQLNGNYPSTGAITLSAATLLAPLGAFARRFWPALVILGMIAVVALGRLRGFLVRKAVLEELRPGAETEAYPNVIGAWRVVSKLGQGGMGVVLKAVPNDSLDQGEAVALKLMQGESAENAESRKRFLREMKVSKSLEHPHIVRTIDYGDHDGLLYLAVEFIEGTTLTKCIRPEGLSPEEVLKYVRPLAKALAFAHARTVIHRDLKPDNVMLASSGRLVLMDFGLARSADVSQVTNTGTVLGTPAYMAPEQVLGTPPQPSSDQYTLSLMVYEMLVGRRAFDMSDMRESLFARLHGLPEPPSALRPGLDAGIDAVVLKALSVNPEDRYPGVLEFVDDLELAASGAPTLAEAEAAQAPTVRLVRPRPAEAQAPAPSPAAVAADESDATSVVFSGDAPT